MLGGSRPGCPLSPRRRCALTSVPELSTVCVCVLTGGEFLSSAVRRASAARQCEAAACTHACPPACTSTPPAHPRGHHAAASRAPWVSTAANHRLCILHAGAYVCRCNALCTQRRERLPTVSVTEAHRPSRGHCQVGR